MKTAILLWVALLAACRADLPEVRSLTPDPNPLRPGDPFFSPQPHRDRPRALCTSPDGKKAWVMLAGTEDAAGTEVAVVDLVAGTVRERIPLARSPWACSVDPSGRWVVVTLRFSDRAAVLDAATDREIARVEVPWYTETVRWRQDGRRVWFANRWKDSVLWWDVAPGDEFRLVATNYDGIPSEDPMGVPAGDNPGPLAEAAGRLFVGAVTGGTIAVLDAGSGKGIDADADPLTTTVGAPAGMTWLDFHSPVGGLAARGPWLFVADIGAGLGAQPNFGIDIDEDGKPGDGTANQAFQDPQNEIGVVDARSLRQVHRYTSDSICCKDFRDVDPDRPHYGAALPLADQWSSDVVSFLPPRATWIVAGALPEALLARGEVLWVAFAGSNEVQSFRIAPDGSLAPRQTTGGLYRTGFNPKALAAGPGATVVSADRLGEGLSVIDPAGKPNQSERRIIVGDVGGGAFPATDAELGEGINEMTAAFTIDGDQTCVHCHRDNGAIARPFVMPLQSSRAWSLRNVMAQRGLFDTRPWFFESAMNEDNFFPVLNEFARRENFCCEGLDPSVWSKYPKLETCAADPKLPGCHHVLQCPTDPPPECATRPYAQTPFSLRGAFMRDAALRLFGREVAFGDVLRKKDAAGASAAQPLDFTGVTRAIGLFMLRTPRLLPNPNRALDLPSSHRGQALFRDPGVGCNGCHPLPLTTTAALPVAFSPFGMPVRFPPVISPERRPDGSDAMLVNDLFIATFPLTLQTPVGLHLGATPLRGLWDRPQTRLFHDGRARSLRSALASPGHPALRAGEPGFNERNGVFDTHGGTSHLDRYQFEDLLQFVLTL